VNIPFLQAKYYTQTNGRKLSHVVLHSMESQEKPDTAETVAKWFAGAGAPRASAHYCVDSDSAVQCVRDKDVAWHAPGLNSSSIGIEHAGRAGQSASEWDDPYSRAMLAVSARLVAGLCAKYGIPVEYVPARELVNGKKGITTHAEVSRAWGRSSHWDPGPNFPMVPYLNSIRAAKLPPLPEPGGPDVSAVVDARCAPEGGVWVFARDGGVFTYGGAPFHGSYPGLPANVRNDPSRQLAKVELNDRGGYDLFMQGSGPDPERYSFP
jgi:N-acetylmuramoyl-L-alanine amidase-like protein